MNSMPITLQQKIVCLENRRQWIPLAGPEAEELMVLTWPADIVPIGRPVRKDQGWLVEVEAHDRRLAYAPVRVRASQHGQRVECDIPSRIFADKELFLCFATTSNFHWGHDPSMVGELEAAGSKEGWPDAYGDPLRFHGHAYPSSRYFAEGVHAQGFPMTWMIDGDVARAGATEITRFHQQHGDDVALLPSSYFFGNPVNYNTEKTLDETIAVLDATRTAVQRAFAAQGWPLQASILGVDSWVGAAGTHWIQAAAKAGMRGVFGICFDHETCDTSTYHEGAPWECYRMQSGNFRYPSDNPADLWAFPWTLRDMCNSFLHYPQASVWFSTDPDDIKGCQIMENQPDYWNLLVDNHLKSLAHSDFGCLVIHNEDHDAHRVWSQNYIRNFLEKLPRDTVVPATFHEVQLWLDLRYADGSHPKLLIEADDPLRCHDAVHAFLSTNQWSKERWNPGSDWKTKDGRNPTVVCAYDLEARWFAVEGEPVPRQYIAYTKPVAFAETGTSPKERIPVLSDWQEAIAADGNSLTVTFRANIAFLRLPLLWWNRPELQAERKTRTASIVVGDIHAGENRITVRIVGAPLAATAVAPNVGVPLAATAVEKHNA